MIKAVIFDMDGTVLKQIKGEEAFRCEPGTWIDVWRQFFYAAGLAEECRRLTRQYQDVVTNSMTPYGFEEFFRKSCDILKGKPAVPVLATFRDLPYTSGFLDFCQYLQENKLKTGMVTLSIDAVVQQIKSETGLEFAIGNEIHYDENGLFTGAGKINVPFGGKGKALEQAYTTLGASHETTAYFGDSGNDVDCWKAVDYPLGIDAPTGYGDLLKVNFTDFIQAKDYFKREILG